VPAPPEAVFPAVAEAVPPPPFAAPPLDALSAPPFVEEGAFAALLPQPDSEPSHASSSIAW